MTVDFRSDTFTLPSDAMRREMAAAPCGDDYYGEDESVNALEAACCELFGKEAAVFVVTGMLANSLAVASQTTRGNEVVTGYDYHLNLYESAQHATLSQVVLNARPTNRGVLEAAEVERAIATKPRESFYAQVELVTIENTINSQAGKVFPIEEIEALRRLTSARKIRLHLDGARLFNAHVATGIPLARYASLVDSVSVCFSKALGAPIGSVLMGSRDMIDRARRLRVWYGAGFHQAGICARAAHHALTKQLDRLAEDHELTKRLARGLAEVPGVEIDVDAVETNMLFVDMARARISPEELCAVLAKDGVLIQPFPPTSVRFVLCRNVDREGVDRAIGLVAKALASAFAPS